jgi:hypothetical protein
MYSNGAADIKQIYEILKYAECCTINIGANLAKVLVL